MQSVISQRPVVTSGPALQRAQGHLRISASRSNQGTTRIVDLFQEGCLKVRLPRPDSDEEVSLALINIAGGLTGGDRLLVEVTIGSGARATVTTPACERIYRSIGGEASLVHRLSVGRGARLDWIPQETILFDRSRLRRQLDITLEADSEVTIAESVLFGRTAMGETVQNCFFSDFWTIRRGHKMLFADATRIVGSFDQTQACPAVLGGRNAMASLVYAGRDPVCKRDALLACFMGAGDALAGATVVGEVLIARIVAPGGAALRRLLIPALDILRASRPLPRLWSC